MQRAVQSVKRELESRPAVAAPNAPCASAPVAPNAPAHLAHLSPVPLRWIRISMSVSRTSFEARSSTFASRVSEYLPLFEGASDVLDVGCGRGEFLDLLKARGITARGSRYQRRDGRRVSRARPRCRCGRWAVSYLASLPDGSLGGLIAAQVVEHLEPDYLMRFLETAYHKLRPGSKIVLETINPHAGSRFSRVISATSPMFARCIPTRCNTF